MKNKLLTFIILITSLTGIFSLNSCSKVFKMQKTTPDESTVSTRPSLAIPPNFNLPSPQQGKVLPKKQKTKTNLTAKNIKPNSSTLKKEKTPTKTTSSDKKLIEKLHNSKPTNSTFTITPNKKEKDHHNIDNIGVEENNFQSDPINNQYKYKK